MYKNLKQKIRTIPNWPKSGIMFRDITTLLKDSDGLVEVVEIFFNKYKNKNLDYVVGIESRGFIFGAMLALKLGLGFVPIRKSGKLPGLTVNQEYKLEYGNDKIEIHKDAIEKGSKVVLVDDLIATGGTALAACRLLEIVGAQVVGCCFLVDLPDLRGCEKLKRKGYDVFKLLEFEGD